MVNWWWTNPVFNRVLQDVIDGTKKGMFNAVDISRIEHNIGNLSRHIGIATESKDWTRNDFPKPYDYARIIQNASTLKQVYPFISINVPPNILRWDLTNDIEEILFEIKRLWDTAIIWDCFDVVFDDWDNFEDRVISWDQFETYDWCRHMQWNLFDEANRIWDVIDEEGFFINA